MTKYFVIGVLCVALAAALCGIARAEEATEAAPPMKIVPAPEEVVIDGDLTEWNQEGKLGPATFDPDSIDDFSATCYAMYDQENLYLAR